MKEEIGDLEESPISFWLSRSNERLSRNDQLDEDLVSSGDLVVLSPRQKLKKRPTRKEKGKMKMPEYGTNTGAFDHNDLETDSEQRRTYGKEVGVG